MTEIRRLTVWELVVWAYHRQQAHRALRTPHQAFRWAFATIYCLDPDQPRPTVHYDAAMVHAAVLDLDPELQPYLIGPASEAQRPALPDVRPRARPLDADRTSREHWAVVDGVRTYYAVLPFRYVTETRSRHKRIGRKMVLQGVDHVKVPADEYCPLDWSPDPGAYTAAIGLYGGWSAALAQLTVTMADVELRDHRLEPDPAPPPPPPAALVYDSWSAAKREADPREVEMTVDPAWMIDWRETGPQLCRRVAGTRVGR